VHASWSRLLTERGAVIDDDAAVRLVAVTLRTPITRIYDNPHHSDFEPRKQELTVDALRTRVVVSVDGYGAWQVETYSEPPRLLQRDRGQSVEEAVRASVPEDGPLKFVRKLDLPQSVAVPGERWLSRGGFEKQRLSPRGVGAAGPARCGPGRRRGQTWLGPRRP